jgi:DNA repair exonuclease SbcCD nuclease subunit
LHKFHFQARDFEATMPQRPFRFIHASDFHLETPVQGMAEVHDQLRAPLLDAPYTAAARVFDAALAEEVDFLVLSGDIVNPHTAGLRGPLFLVEQFSRLAQRSIPVYWVGGEVDPPEAWPPAFPLPENVRVFPKGRVSEFLHERDGTPLARLVGLSQDGNRPLRLDEFRPDPASLFSIAAAHGNFDVATLAARGIHYWALGGRHERGTPAGSGSAGANAAVVHYPGTCQGRRPEEAGAHGCTLVDVDAQGQVRLSFLATDSVRWLSERLVLEEKTSREGLESLLRERLRALVETTPKMDLLISWTLAGSGPLLGQLRRGALGNELLGWLRSEYGMVQPLAWSASLEVEPALTLPPAWYEQDTIRGDFLRAVRQLEMNPNEPLELETMLADAHQAGNLAAAATVLGKAERQRVLRDAALLAVELLSGDE